MSLILLIGNATLNIINEFTQKQHIQSARPEMKVIGGHAANMALVLAQHRHAVEWMGVLGADAEARWLKQALIEQDVNVDLAFSLAQGRTPTSYINHYQTHENQSVVHYRDLPELPLEAFNTCDFSRYDWIHLEGRNAQVLTLLLPRLAKRFDQVLSLDIRRSDPDLEALILGVDVVFFSKLFVQQQKVLSHPESFLADQHRRYPAKVLICHWGNEGAYAIDKEGQVEFIAAQAVPVLETLGAGDVFRAAMIHGLAIGKTLVEALGYAVCLTEQKVGQRGLSNLV